MWSFEKDKVPVAVELFRRAVDIDPTFSAAYAYLAYSHYIHVIMGWVDNPDRTVPAIMFGRNGTIGK